MNGYRLGRWGVIGRQTSGKMKEKVKVYDSRVNEKTGNGRLKRMVNGEIDEWMQRKTDK